MSELAELKELLLSLNSVLIAYSGGVDSTFLLKVAQDTLGGNVLAVIGESETFPQSEVRMAVAQCETMGVRRRVIKTEEFLNPRFVANDKERCYYCKSELFSKCWEIAGQQGIPYVLDGSNADDQADYRPGKRACSEQKVRSPLQELGFTKEEIRKYSKELGLPTWDKPAMACLSSRIPYGTKITEEILRMVGDGEGYLRGLGFRELRVRHHGTIARIELGKKEMQLLWQEGLMDQIARKFEELGYLYVTVDLKGYRTGSMNEMLAN